MAIATEELYIGDDPNSYPFRPEGELDPPRWAYEAAIREQAEHPRFTEESDFLFRQADWLASHQEVSRRYDEMIAEAGRRYEAGRVATEMDMRRAARASRDLIDRIIREDGSATPEEQVRAA